MSEDEIAKHLANQRRAISDLFDEIAAPTICDLTDDDFGPFLGQIDQRSFVPDDWIDAAPFVGELWLWLHRVRAFHAWADGNELEALARRDMARMLRDERRAMCAAAFDMPCEFADRLGDEWQTPLGLRGRREAVGELSAAILELREIAVENARRLDQWEQRHAAAFQNLDSLADADGNKIRAFPLVSLIVELGRLWQRCPAANTRGRTAPGYRTRKGAFVCTVLAFVGATTPEKTVEKHLAAYAPRVAPENSG